MLAKNETATRTLRLLYEQKESIIKNLITFTADTADKKLYADKGDFADCYPFIPYQFNLLGQVLTAVRTHGASGKHLSDQSRSMLALFQESAIRVMDKEDGVLVPFSFFYDPLHKFIDHQEPATRINEALGKLVAMKYNKLTYMETAPELSDISAIFKHSDGQMSFLGTSDTTPNKLALEEVVQVIGLNNARHMKTSLKSLQDKFGAAPYGFDPKDVQWLVAMLFKLGRVSLTLNSQSLSLLSTNSDELVRYITRREYVEKLLIDIRERATDGQIRSAKEVMKDYFGFTVSSDDDDKIMNSFKSRAKDKVEVYDDILVEYRINPKYPCKRLMEEARKRLAEILDINEPTEFFKTVDKKRDDLLDDAEDTAPVFDFFKGDQKKIFEEAVKNLAYFGNSKTYVSDQELLKEVEEIETIVKDSKPFSKIQRLPELNKRFEELHMGLLEKEAAIMDPLVHDDFLA